MNAAREFKQARSSRACFHFKFTAMKLARLLRVFADLNQEKEFIMKTLIGAAAVAGALVFEVAKGRKGAH